MLPVGDLRDVDVMGQKGACPIDLGVVVFARGVRRMLGGHDASRQGPVGAEQSCPHVVLHGAVAPRAFDLSLPFFAPFPIAVATVFLP